MELPAIVVDEVSRFSRDSDDAGAAERASSRSRGGVRWGHAILSLVELTIHLVKEDDGRWIADLPALPGVMVYGDTRERAIRACKALALRVIAERLEHGEDIFTGQPAGNAMDVPPGLTFGVAA